MKYLKTIGSMLLIILGGVFLAFILGNSTSQSKKAVSNLSEKVNQKVPWHKYDNHDSKQKVVVSTSNPYATKIGMDILHNGGNAADAAVGVSYALAVTEPYASGLGGGGGMLIYDPKKNQYHGINYRDSAPVSHQEISSEIGVPTFVKGMDFISREYGTHPMADNMEGAVSIAKKGFKVSPFFAKYINIYRYFLKDNKDYINNNGKLLKQGDHIYPKKMTRTLNAIQQRGIAGYYSGPVAKSIMHNSDLTQRDLNSARVEVTKPVVTKIGNAQFATLAAPFSGVTLLQMLKMTEKNSLADPAKQPDTYLTQYRAIKQLAYEDRMAHLGDPTYSQINSQKMVSNDYINKLLDGYDGNANLNKQESDSQNTTHFSIIDEDGMAVSSTNTLGSFFGSQIEAGGFYLNAANRLFTSGKNSINRYEPGKKPRNFTAPVIIRTANKETVALGTPGGNMIPEFLFQIIYDHNVRGTSYQKAIDKNRLYLTKQNKFVLEGEGKRKNYLAVENIKDTSYETKKTSEFFGSVQIAYRNSNTGEVHTYSDTRRDANLNN